VTIKDILVHVDTSPACSARVVLAAALAHRFGAALTGIFILPSREFLELMANDAAITLALNLTDLERAAAKLEDEFWNLLRRRGLTGEWYAAHDVAAPCIIGRGRTADLVILGQRDPEHSAILEAPEEVILACGRPVLVVPYAGHFEHVGRDVLIAWNGSREATLAMHEALPLMAASSAVTTMTVGVGDDPRAEAQRPATSWLPISFATASTPGPSGCHRAISRRRKLRCRVPRSSRPISW